jgi:RNA polymerase sigma factor (sigma-70 family)
MTLGPAFDGVMTAARTGADWAWTELYRDLAPVVLGYFRAHGADEADDLTSEVFVSMVRNLAAFEGNEEQFRSWVFVIVHRRLLDERRHKGRHPVDPTEHDRLDSPAPADVEGAAIDSVQTERIRETFSQLSDDQRDVLLLRVVADMSIEETARLLRKTRGAVKSLQHRGLSAVAKILADQQPVSP